MDEKHARIAARLQAILSPDLKKGTKNMWYMFLVVEVISMLDEGEAITQESLSARLQGDAGVFLPSLGLSKNLMREATLAAKHMVDNPDLLHV